MNGKTLEEFSKELSPNDVLEVVVPKMKKIRLVFQQQETHTNVSLLLFNKPKWYVVSKEDKHNKTIYELLPQEYKKFYYIGRLDKNSHGLLLLTDNPRMVDLYESPSSKIDKIYRVVIDKQIGKKDMERMKKWLWVSAEWKLIPSIREWAHKLSFSLIKYSFEKRKHVLTIYIHEGKKRHIRRLLKSLHYKVLDLQRTAVGEFTLWNLKLGQRRLIKRKKLF